MPRLALLLALLPALLLTLAACNPTTPSTPAPPDLAPLQEQLDTLTADVQALTTQVNLLRGETTTGLEAARADVRALAQEAIDLQAIVAQPLSISDVDLSTITGLTIDTVPPSLDVLIEPGECTEEQAGGPRRATRPADTLVLSTFHVILPGTYCVYTPDTDQHLGTGETITITEGAITGLALIPFTKPTAGP